MFTTENEFDEAVAQAKAAGAAYYDTDMLLMSDADYDQLTDQIAATLTAHPDWNDDGVITKVAAGASAGGTLTHPQPMLSLDKTTDLDQVAAFTKRVPGDVVVELKLDHSAWFAPVGPMASLDCSSRLTLPHSDHFANDHLTPEEPIMSTSQPGREVAVTLLRHRIAGVCLPAHSRAPYTWHTPKTRSCND